MATDFFERQDAARRTRTRLVVLFAIAVVVIIVSVDCLVALVLAYIDLESESGLLELAGRRAIDPGVLAFAVGGTLLVVTLGSVYKIADLWGGGPVVAEHLGGRRLNADTTVPAERRLLNVVEEMAIASGTATPPVYLLEDEDGMNAFAAGFSLEDAVIGVTRGTAERLSRDELQGVVAHEFSHILNGDMRLNLRLIGLLHGIMVVALIGQFIFRVVAYSGISRRGSRDNNPLPVVALGSLALGAGLIAIGFVGMLCGSIIKAAVSRQREFLADASAVQFTRNPLGIAGALKKIGGFARGAAVESPNAPEISHLFFGQATSGLTSMFATHPPLAERISRLDPAWDGEFVESHLPPDGERLPRPLAPTAEAAVVAPLASFDTGPGLRTAVADIGQPSQAHLQYASQLVQQMPDVLIAAAHDTYSARALVYALLIDRQHLYRERQLSHLTSHADAGVLKETRRLIMPVARLDPRARLPLVEMAIPALAALTQAQYHTFKENVGVVIEADDQLGLFEWTVQRIVTRHLDAQRGRGRSVRVRHRTLGPVGPQCALVLSMLAWVGHPAERSAATAFSEGWRLLGLPSSQLFPLDRCDFVQLDRALTDLDGLAPVAKRTLLQASATCIESDAAVTVNESELLRAVAASLSSPMPPLVFVQVD